jgi:hypothetical protein
LHELQLQQGALVRDLLPPLLPLHHLSLKIIAAHALGFEFDLERVTLHCDLLQVKAAL